MKRGSKILNISSFRDDSSSTPIDLTAFVRAFALYLDERLDFSLSGKLRGRLTSGGAARKPVRDMKPAMFLDQISHWPEETQEQGDKTNPTVAPSNGGDRWLFETDSQSNPNSLRAENHIDNCLHETPGISTAVTNSSSGDGSTVDRSVQATPTFCATYTGDTAAYTAENYPFAAAAGGGETVVKGSTDGRKLIKDQQ